MPMKPGMMMVMDQIDRQQRYPRSEYGGDPQRRMIGYDRDYPAENRRMAYGGMEPESRRRRDSRGRFMESEYMPYMGGYRNEYDERRYGMDGRYGMETESRRRRDSRGRYATGGRDPRMMGDDYDDDDDDMRGQTWYPPEMNSGSRYGFGDVFAEIHAPGSMNRPMGGMGMMGGMMGGDMSKPVDEHTARKWVEKMDGGEHFKMEQADQLRTTICPDCDKAEFYVALNAMYSDHCESAKKLGMDKPEFYAHLAKDFLNDKDAKPNKLRIYMTYIPK